MKRRNVCWVLAILGLLMLTACAGQQAGEGSSEEMKTQQASGDVVKAEIPEGWSLVSGTEMNGANGADYICHAEKFEIGDPYLQAEKTDQDLEKMQGVLESGDTFGKYLGSFDLGGNTWYIAENAAAAEIDGKVCLVRGYECDFSGAQVQAILGSIQWVN